MDSLKQRILDYVSANQPAKVDLIYKGVGISRNRYYEEAKELRFMGRLRSVPGMEKLVNQRHTNDPLDVTPAKAKKMADIVETWTPPEGWSGDMAEKMKGYIVEFLRGCNGFRSH